MRDRSDKLEFSRFDITRVLQKGSALLGSAGTEFDMDENELAGMVLNHDIFVDKG